MGGNKLGYALMRKALDMYNAPVHKAIDLAHGKFSQDLPMPELVKKADEVTSVGVQAGEGWLLTAEILELIESGCPNVICAQPFACLPNHVTGEACSARSATASGSQHRVHRLRSGSIRSEPAQPHQLMIAAAKKAHKAAQQGETTQSKKVA